MQRKILSIIWIVSGILMMLFGFRLYWNYSTPGIMWLFIIPEKVALINILVGVIGIKVGKRIWYNNDQELLKASMFCSSILGLGLVLYEFLDAGYFRYWYDIFSILYLLVLVIISIVILRRSNSGMVNDVPKFSIIILKEWKLSVFLLVLILLMSNALLYESLGFLHEIEWLNEIMKDNLERVLG